MLCTMLTWAKSGLATSPLSPPSLLILGKEVLRGLLLVMKMADLPLKPAKQTVESGKLWKALDDLVPVKDKNQQVESSDTIESTPPGRRSDLILTCKVLQLLPNSSDI